LIMTNMIYAVTTPLILTFLFFSPSARWVGCCLQGCHADQGYDCRPDRHMAGVWVLFSLMILMMPFISWAGDSTLVHGNDIDHSQVKTTLPDRLHIWQTGIGEGFRPGTQAIGISAGASYGVLIFGGEEHHHIALTSLSYGTMVGDVKGVGTWYQGNWELRCELFGGAQFNSETDWLVGLAPHVRYNFATGTRWIPYVDVGGGVTLTEIRAPDLGGTFQFNLQASIGTNYFFQDNMAVSLEGRYLHLSSAHLTAPNNGVNTIGAFCGINIFF